MAFSKIFIQSPNSLCRSKAVHNLARITFPVHLSSLKYVTSSNVLASNRHSSKTPCHLITFSTYNANCLLIYKRHNKLFKEKKSVPIHCWILNDYGSIKNSVDTEQIIEE